MRRTLSVCILVASCAGDESEPMPKMDASTIDASTPRRDAAAMSIDAESVDPARSDASRVDASRADAARVDASREDAAVVATTECSNALSGWATVSGDGVATTSGGGNAKAVRPQTAAQLAQYASSASPQVIEIAGSFEVANLMVASDKTLIGIGDDATIHGGITIKAAHNVIVQNLHLDGVKAETSDTVHVEDSHHLWIDHCDIYDGADGNLDMTHAANWVTVSWTRIRYTDAYHNAAGEEVSAHRFASLIGHSDDNAEEDRGRLNITYHHNDWGDGVLERMPRVRFGQVHVFNSYLHATGNHYCARAGKEAALLIEANYFEQVSSPHEFNSDADEKTASIVARDNVYERTTGEKATGGGGAAFERAPYAATLDDAAEVPNRVRLCAGPR